MRPKIALAATTAFLCAMSSYAYRVSAWVPTWDPNALTSMQLHAGSLDESNPGWYSLDATGAIVKNWNAENPDLRAALTGTRLIPTIKNYVNGSFNASVVTSVIATADSRERHAEALRQLAVQNAFDGIDLDYEAVPASAKTNFAAFVNLLAEKLHASNKRFSLTVAADGWLELGANADSVKIMAYDKHWPGGAPGAITPLDWLDAVVTNAEAKVDPVKLMIGLPWYGYDWSGGSAAAVTYASAMQIAANNGITPSRDANGELTFTYAGHTVFFQDAESYARKVNAVIAKHPYVGGFAHWRAGAEDPQTWARITALRGNTSGATPAPQPPPPARLRPTRH